MTIAGTGLIDPILTFVDAAGVPYASGTVTFYATGTQNLQDVFSDTALTVALANPMTLNAAGRSSSNGTNTSPVYFQPLFYDYVLKDSTGAIVYGPETFNGSAWPGALQGTVTLSPAASANAYANRVTTTINKAASGTAALFAGTRFDATTIGANTSTLTEASTVYIDGAPTAGSSTYALHVAAGTVRFDGGVIGINNICQGRLTLTSGTAVTTGDVTGATSVYFTPYQGNGISLYDGSSSWALLSFTELTLPLGTLTSGLPYDVFAYNNNGMVSLRSPVAWTNGTTRATALALQNGIYVKTGATTDRYLGTFYTTSTTQTEDSAAKRFLWNYYNRVRRPVQRLETTVSWTYTTATIRQANGATANKIEAVVGVAEVTLDLLVQVAVSNSTGGVTTTVGIGEDTTTAFTIAQFCQTGAGLYQQILAKLVKIPAVGYHYYSWNEYSAATGTTTWQANSALPSNTESGLTGWTEG